MLFTILDIFFRILIIVLLVRFFIEKYQYYGYGPVLYAVMEATNRMLMPLRQLLPPSSRLLHEYLPLTAIVFVVMIRGAVLWLFGSWHPLYTLSPATGFTGLPVAIGLSAAMAVMLIAEMLVLFLFASMMVSRFGIMACSNAGFLCFQEKTYQIFQCAKKVIQADDLRVLFLFSAFVILMVCGVLSGLFTFSFLKGPELFYATAIVSIFEVLNSLVFLYMLILLLSILTSWVGADHFSLMVQILKAMTEPYLNIFRRLCPWARIDFIDLSPVFAFIVLNPVLMVVLQTIKEMLILSVMGGDASPSGFRMV